MKSTQCIAMILAGGQGSRLGALTEHIAKPAVPFGGKYRIIDFPLSNCAHSGIDTVGVLTQYQPLELNTYIGNGQPWDLDRNDGGVFVLPPYVKAEKGEWYSGTANAIYQNIPFIEQFDPEYVLILSGDHIYKMNYDKMLQYHKVNQAGATIAVIEVPKEEASRFGIMHTDEEGRVLDFEEKPKEPKSNLASMGVYIFSWKLLKKYLIIDENNVKSDNDFGKNIIPAMLNAGERLFAYAFQGYWKDVGTIQSLWEANMDLLRENAPISLYDPDWKLYSRSPVKPPHYMAASAVVKNAWVTEGCNIHGTVENSIIFEGVTVEEGAYIQDSIVFPGCTIGEGSRILKSIIGSGAQIGKNVSIGAPEIQSDAYYSPLCTGGISLVANDVTIQDGIKIGTEAMVSGSIVGTQEIGGAKQKDVEVG